MGRVVGKTRMVIFGDVDDAGIDTVYVARYNLTSRETWDFEAGWSGKVCALNF